MADSSLDDFFAKKDKNKKSKKKNITTEEIGKKLEESGRKFEKQKKNKEKTNTTQSAINVNILEQEDEEWNDFVEEREKDYSGLRIQTLSIKDKEEELREQQMQENEEEGKKESQSGPWKLSTPITRINVDEGDDDINDDINKINAPITVPQQQGGKYVPPHLRGVNANTPTSLTSTKRSKFGAPKIGDAIEFPTLGTPSEAFDEIKGFQAVKYGGRDNLDRSSTQVTLDNKYGVLTNRNKEEVNSE